MQPLFYCLFYRSLRYIELRMATLVTTTEIRNFIGGNWHAPTSPSGLVLTNPATGDPLGNSPAGSAAEVHAAVEAAQAAFPTWRATPPADRVQYLFKLKNVLEEQFDELAAPISRILRLVIGRPQARRQSRRQSDLRAGEIVLSIGRSRLGDISASSGIVARTGSAWRTSRGGQIDRLIRPDVFLYVGQSGSALVDRESRVIGMNSQALARLAVITIPAQTIDRVVDAVLERGHVPRPYLGIAMQPVPVPETVRAHVQPETEQVLLITHLQSKGPGAQAGAMVGDLIIAADGTPVHHIHDILRRLADSRIGDNIALTVVRGGEKKELAVTVADRD